MSDALRYRMGGWYLYDISCNFDFYDLCQIVGITENCYILKMYTAGYCFPGITIACTEFERNSLPISDEDAMLEKLTRKIN